MQQLMLMIGTRKGAFLAFSDRGRKTGDITGPIFKGAQVDHVAYAPDIGGAIVVTGTSAWWARAPDLHRSWRHLAGTLERPLRGGTWTLRGADLDHQAGADGDR